MKGFDMATKDSARDALYETIEALAKETADTEPTHASAAVRDLAIAWRAVAGGVQPGSIIVEK